MYTKNSNSIGDRMSELETFINGLEEDELEYLAKNVLKAEGGCIGLKELDLLIDQESTLNSQKDSVQYSLKINLNSVSQ